VKKDLPRNFILGVRHIFRTSRSSSDIKVTRSRSRPQEQNACLCVLFLL